MLFGQKFEMNKCVGIPISRDYGVRSDVMDQYSAPRPGDVTLVSAIYTQTKAFYDYDSLVRI